jgi:F-type H+-transporting ATPase subunit b
MLSNPTFWVAVSTAIFVLLALKMGAATAVTSALDGRGKLIAAELAEAKRLRVEAETLLAEYEAKRKAAEAEATSIVAQARSDAERLAKEAEAKLSEFVTRRTKTAEEKIAQAETQAMNDVRTAAAEAATRAAEVVLRQQMSGKGGLHALGAGLRDVRAKLN